ncbi:CynX/NimT family MFS transporter [Streptomyces abyssomicinicus]|uniref:CynX/NimT family MFS transporter n=1 Tax=Streptomyces abyssomicinicus TaxID=574929 RepID=UPI0012504AD9|nr:MFS transporter [Streptomyces abyssomicinicus]
MSDGRSASYEATENPATRPSTRHGGNGRGEAGLGVDAAPVVPHAWRTRLLVAAVVLAALNLRPAVTSLGALLEEVREGFGMSGAVAGLLTSVPSLCFAVFGVAAPRLARRFGAAAVVCAGMAAIALGLLIRPWTGVTAGLLAATALALMGIAVSNILMPVIVKERFPDRVGPMTGLYSMALAMGTSSAAAFTVPLTGALGGDWRLGLTAWSLLALAAALVWLPLLRDRDRPGDGTRGRERGLGTAPRSRGRARAAAHTPAPAPAPAGGSAGVSARPPMRSITRSRTAWALAVFFGLQSTCAYVTMGWLAQIFRDAGVSAGTAGVLLAVSMVMGVPLSFVIPRMAARLPHQGPIVIALGVSGLAGYAGLILAPAAGAWLWAVLLGLANCAFPLALTMVGMRARTGEGVGRLSAFAQSTGYLISIPGPVLVGVLYQHSGGWALPLTLMAALMIPQMVFGVLAGKNRTVEDELAPRQEPATAALR